jgi:hypothetical protein
MFWVANFFLSELFLSDMQRKHRICVAFVPSAALLCLLSSDPTQAQAHGNFLLSSHGIYWYKLCALALQTASQILVLVGGARRETIIS